MNIGFIGAGKVGFTLGKYFKEHGIRVTGYYSRGTDSAREAGKFTQTRAYEDLGEMISDCDVLFLTVPDGVIASVFEEVKKHSIKDKVICHASGAMTAREAFAGIDDTKAFGYSVHPLFAVSDKYQAYKELSDVFFAVEGTGAIEKIGSVLTEAGLNWQQIDPEGKKKYHLAAAIASNHVIALLKQSYDMLVGVGFSKDKAMDALAPLVMGNVKHVLTAGPIASLTGPVERADKSTIQKHLAELSSEKDKKLYALISLKLVEIAKEKHPQRDYKELERILLTY